MHGFDRFVVFGQIAQDIVAGVPELPTPGASTSVPEVRWLLGGKGANQAVGLRQLGAVVAVAGVVGDDPIGAELLAAMLHDGIDVCGVARRGSSAVLFDVVDRSAKRMLLEHVPTSALLTAADVRAAGHLVEHADAVCLQAQQPGDALTAAAALARRSGAIIALDGAPDADATDELLAAAEIVRVDATEAGELVGFPVSSLSSGEEACRVLLARGPRVAAVEVAGAGDLVAWADGTVFLPHGDDEVVKDRTGAGDAFFVGLVRGLGREWTVERAADLAHRAAASTVARLGGRPDLEAIAG